MSGSILHIVFSDTVAGSLIAALQELGREDRVLALSDNLSFGPISPPNLALRRDWIRGELGPDLDEAEWPFDRIGEFWDAALSTSARKIVWVSKRAAHEYAGFLELAWRLGDAPFEVVEFNQDEVIRQRAGGQMSGGTAICLGELPPYHLKEKRYWEGAVPLDAAARDRYRANWARLRDENAPLRIIDESGLVSVPITYFDDLLLSCAVDQWRKVARVIGETLYSFLDGPYSQVGHLVLEARVRALVAAGRLESKGDLSRPRFSEVRLPQSERRVARGA